MLRFQNGTCGHSLGTRSATRGVLESRKSRNPEAKQLRKMLKFNKSASKKWCLKSLQEYLAFFPLTKRQLDSLLDQLQLLRGIMLVNRQLPGPGFNEAANSLAVFDLFIPPGKDRRRNSHVLVYHGPLLIHLLGVAPSAFTTGYLFLSPHFECQVTVASRKIHSGSLHCEILDHTWSATWSWNKVFNLVMAAHKKFNWIYWCTSGPSSSGRTPKVQQSLAERTFHVKISWTVRRPHYIPYIYIWDR